MENGKLIALSQYLQTQKNEVEVDQDSPTVVFDTDCAVLDFLTFKNKASEKKARLQRAKLRSYSLLNVIKALVADYDIDMKRAAEQCDVEAYVKEYGHTPEVQISHDLRRLNEWVQSLEGALEVAPVRTLLEACNVLREKAAEEVVDTLNYILVSEYFGFQAIKSVLEAARLTEEAYFENTVMFYSLWNAVAEADFPNTLSAVAQLCFEEAVAI